MADIIPFEADDDEPTLDDLGDFPMLSVLFSCSIRHLVCAKCGAEKYWFKQPEENTQYESHHKPRGWVHSGSRILCPDCRPSSQARAANFEDKWTIKFGSAKRK